MVKRCAVLVERCIECLGGVLYVRALYCVVGLCNVFKGGVICGGRFTVW